MVVAEVPLWVVHSTASHAGPSSLALTPKMNSTTNVGSGGDHDIASSTNSNNNNSKKSANGSGGGGSNSPFKEQRAMESLTLLEGLGGTHKCAIYSLDVHPTGQKFATGGGDGTVRIWNADALFCRSHVPSTNKRNGHSAVYKEGGAYESSGESSGAEESHGSYSAAARATTDYLAQDSVGSGSEASLVGEEEAVHDLSSLVRRKKDSSSTTTPTKNDKVTNNGTTIHSASQSNPKASSPQHQHHQHHHHHHHRHRLLCTLSAHTGSSVLAVRFSNNGQYLASAGDDSAVCIYSPATNSQSTIVPKGNLDSSVEHWTRIKLCRGHALDVVGLAWAPDDSHLVSCSLDSNAPIIVWKLTDLATSHHHPTHSNVIVNPYRVLGKGIHTSTVKGVTFDPAGSYLASSGDDPSVCVWRAHDDWGLEKRIDAKDGIFRQWKEGDSQSLSSQSLFRRLSWSTDGAYICATNAVVKNKNVASTISREGWAVSSAKSTASGAANLVGHKQPVVACRHCPFLLDSRPSGQQRDDDEEPEYATLLALGDKRGFVTVWSTKRSRPVFKIQCSETRCTVTDMAWGKVQNDIMLLISLLDGQVVALKFAVPDELGNLLKQEEQDQVFQLRYGIELNDSTLGSRRLFVGENSAPKLIENALQYSLEDQEEEEASDSGNMDVDETTESGTNRNLSSGDVKASQTESRTKGGKKRIQPLLVSVDAPVTKKAKPTNGNGVDKAPKKKVDSLEGTLELAMKAATGAEAAIASQKTSSKTRAESIGETSTNEPREGTHHVHHTMQQYPAAQATPQIPHSTDRIHSMELPISGSTLGDGVKLIADCTNSMQVPQGSRGGALPCITVTISQSGKTMWKDQIPGSQCCAIAASNSLLAVGTTDGCVQLYASSPTLGWATGIAFRSHPPFVWSKPIVALQLHEKKSSDGISGPTEMLVVSADGAFGVYSVTPQLKVLYKGSIMAPMSHMFLSSDMSNELHLPRVARIQITDSSRLLLLLSLHSTQSRSAHEESRNTTTVGAGGSLQAFVYDQPSELWMRMADSRFVLSDFYTSLPSTASKLKNKKNVSGELSKLDDYVLLGATSSTIKPSRRGRALADSHAGSAYQLMNDTGNDMATRAHCENRMACAIALQSASEFEHWLSLYVRTLTVSGNESSLRILVDLLRGNEKENSTSSEAGNTSCWWLSSAPTILGLDRKRLIKTIVIPEMSKNRALQRITNEVGLEIDLS